MKQNQASGGHQKPHRSPDQDREGSHRNQQGQTQRKEGNNGGPGPDGRRDGEAYLHPDEQRRAHPQKQESTAQERVGADSK
ncbi:MAG TPA: hypothetical protein VHM91_11190 [Verrucomicrobiales bacterium]|nr:hypothetical protein [Verrucomicrobiales bacterium]